MLLGLKLMPSLRIIALPLAKARPSALLVSRPLVYYHFNLAPPGAAERNKSWTNRMLNKLTTVAADAWANFGKAPEGSWKLRLYQRGERLVDRIDFEELTLKGVDPSLAPSLRNRGVAGKPLEGLSGSDQKSEERPPVIRLIYPPSLYSSLSTPLSDESVHPSLSHLRVLLDSRGPRHRRGFYLWMMITPLTFPLTIIPVIPNIPFFFCAWRSWSHYKAYKSSQYLSSLIDQGFVHPEPNQELDEVYRLFSPSAPNANSALSNCCEVPSSDKRGKPENASDCNLKSISSLTADSNTGPVPHHLLLSRGAVPRILELFSLPDSAAADMYRAMEQNRGTCDDLFPICDLILSSRRSPIHFAMSRSSSGKTLQTYNIPLVDLLVIPELVTAGVALKQL